MTSAFCRSVNDIWDFMKHRVANSYQCFSNDRLSWNVSKKVLFYAM